MIDRPTSVSVTEAISLGIDLGTSELKAVLLSERRAVIGHARVPLSVSRPRPGWSEQDPADWWQACVEALKQLNERQREAYSSVRCIGLSGQMHGAVLLNHEDAVIRPAILWNDSRAVTESARLTELFADSLDVIGSVPMAGLTAPKLLWLQLHEPDAFKAIDCVVSPKDYLRLKLTGQRVTDMSDAAGTCWLDVPNRRWFEPMVDATGLQLQQLPELIEGSAMSGIVIPSVAHLLGIDSGVTVAGGGGDNPASGVGIGAVRAGDSFISLGTSAAVVSITDKPRGNPLAGVHSYCHAVPNQWYAMGAILSGASCLKWIANLLSYPSEQALLDVIANSPPTEQATFGNAPLFLPYLSGERTPYNDPRVRGGFMNLAHDTTAGMMGYSVIEGVGFALRDAMNSVCAAGAVVKDCSLVGGGARSEYWAQLLCDILGVRLRTLLGSELSAAIGAALLAFRAINCRSEQLEMGSVTLRTFSPDASQRETLERRYTKFRSLFAAAHGVAH